MKATDTVAVKRQRLAYLDAARGVLMLLGIVLHAALVYSDSSWLVHDPSGNVAFDWIVSGIHSFRMPAFFWIAGFFTALSLDRVAPRDYLFQRSQRLLLPVIATLLTFKVIELSIIARVPPGHTNNGGFDIGHLWFLVDLLIFSLISAMALLRDGGISRLLERTCAVPGTSIQLLLLLSFAGTVMRLAMELLSRSTAPEIIDVPGVTNLYRLAFYLPYFVFGLLVYRSDAIRQVFARIHPFWLLPSVALHMWLMLHPDAGLRWSAMILFEQFLTWLSIGAVLSLFARLFSKPSPLQTWLADASYPIYLSHHCVVIAMAAVLLNVGAPAGIKFLLVVAVTFVISGAFAWLVQRVGILHWLYTGRAMPQKLRPRRQSHGQSDSV